MIESPSVSLIENAVDKFPANIAILDAEGTIVHVNEEWISFAQENGLVDSIPREGTEYLAVVEADPSESAQDAVDGIQEVLNGDVRDFEMTYPCHSPDQKRWFTMHAAGFKNEGNRYATVVHVDITDRNQRKHELELFESIFSNQIGVALMFDEDGEVILANKKFYEVTEMRPTEVVGAHYDNLDRILSAQSETISELKELLSGVLTGDLDVGSTEVELLIGGKDPMINDVRVQPFEIDAYSKGAIFTARDITKWKKRENQLRLYERAIEGAKEMLFAVDPDYTFLFANRAYRSFHGLGKDDISNLRISDVLDGHELANVRENVDRVLAGERINSSHKREGPQGKLHPLEVQYYPLRGDEGETIGAVAVMEDMTERRERERHLLVLDRLLRHNMHNDMNIINGYAALVAERNEGKTAKWGKQIQSTAEGLLDTVDKQRSIIEMLSKAPEFKHIDIVMVAERIANELQLEYPGADINLEAPQSVTIKTIAQIEKAIAELIENAITHTADNGPTVDIRILEAEDVVTIEVADTGEGIPEEELGVLSGEKEIGALYHGSGMGLWMVNWVVSRSKGQLNFRSRHPQGSIVSIDLPKE